MQHRHYIIYEKRTFFKSDAKLHRVTQAMFTHRRIFLKTHILLSVEKVSASKEQRFRKYPCPHKNAVIFEIRKQIHQMSWGDPEEPSACSDGL